MSSDDVLVNLTTALTRGQEDPDQGGQVLLDAVIDDDRPSPIWDALVEEGMAPDELDVTYARTLTLAGQEPEGSTAHGHTE